MDPSPVRPRTARPRLSPDHQHLLVLGSKFPLAASRMAERSHHERALRHLRPVRPEAPQIHLHRLDDLFHRVRRVRNRRTRNRAGGDSADRRSDHDSVDAVPAADFRFPRAVGDRRAAMPPQLARLCAAVARNPDRRDLVQSSRRILHRLARNGRLRCRNAPARRLRGTRPAPRTRHSCDHRRRRRIYFMYISDPARAPNLVHPHLLDSEPDHLCHHHRLETPVRILHHRAARQPSAKIFCPGDFVLRRRNRIRDSHAQSQRRASRRRRRRTARDQFRRSAQYRNRDHRDRSSFRQPPRPLDPARPHRLECFPRFIVAVESPPKF